MHCTQCGAALAVGQRFCTGCGTAVAAAVASPPAPGAAGWQEKIKAGLAKPITLFGRTFPTWMLAAGVAAVLVVASLLSEGAGGGGNTAYDSSTGYWASSTQAPPPVDIPIQNISQETEVWCWAAVAQQIIMATQGPQGTPPQCALVAMANGAAPQVCCGGYNPQCVRTGSLDQIQQLIQQFGGRYTSLAPPTDPMTLYGALQRGNAVILALQTGPNMGHVVVVRGMSFVPVQGGYEPVLHVNDPMAVYTQPVPFRQLVGIWRDAIVVS
jgi:hypothetical protein